MHCKPYTKMTLVSVTFHGRRYSEFFMLDYVNGKAVIPVKFLCEYFKVPESVTFTIGG